jgi:hypothetical protein
LIEIVADGLMCVPDMEKVLVHAMVHILKCPDEELVKKIPGNMVVDDQ